MTARRPLPAPYDGDGPFRVRDALAVGAGRGRLGREDLVAPLWGIRSPATFGGTVAEYCRAFLPRLPRGAFFSHDTAAALLGVPLPARLEGPLPLHVGVVSPARAPDARDVCGHRLVVDPPDLRSWQGLPVTGAARTWLDLAGRLPLPDLVAAGDFLLHWQHPLTSIGAMTDALARYRSRRGLVLARAALPLLRSSAESPRESKLRLVIVSAGLPEPECNSNIYDARGLFLVRGDLVYRSVNVLLAYHGDHHRGDRSQWRRDLRRQGDVEDEGWQTLPYTDDDLAAPAALVTRLTRRLRARGLVW